MHKVIGIARCNGAGGIELKAYFYLKSTFFKQE